MKIFYSKSRTGGLSSVEAIFYVVILTAVILGVTGTLLAISKSYRQFRSSTDINNSAAIALDRVVRETRNADSVDLANSVLGVNPGRLTLNGTDAVGNPRTVQFYLTAGVLNLKENGVYAGPLNASNTPIANLVFRLLDSGRSKAVKIEMTIAASSTGFSRSDKFYDTTILGGSY
jgi:hypothetical protein